MSTVKSRFLKIVGEKTYGRPVTEADLTEVDKSVLDELVKMEKAQLQENVHRAKPARQPTPPSWLPAARATRKHRRHSPPTPAGRSKGPHGSPPPPKSALGKRSRQHRSRSKSRSRSRSASKRYKMSPITEVSHLLSNMKL